MERIWTFVLRRDDHEFNRKGILLLDAYRTASSTEKQRVEKILKIHEQTDLKKLEEMEWTDKSIGGRLMKLLGGEKEEVRRLFRSQNYRQLEIIRKELVNCGETSQKKVIKNVILEEEK